MERRFSLDEPMDIDKFHNISLKACDDYVKDQKALSDAIAKTKRTINDEQRKVWTVINRKAETIHRIIAIVAYTICCVLYILCWLYLIFSSNVDFSQYGVATVIVAVIVVLALVSWAPIIWLIHLFNGDSVKSKVVWGIILAVTGVWTIGVVFSLIAYIISLLNNEYKLSIKISKLKKYRRMRRRAESKDEAATKAYQSSATAELEKIKKNLGEYEWLFLEWKRQLTPLLDEINSYQRRDPSLRYLGEDLASNIQFCLRFGPRRGYKSNVTWNNFETPRNYISITIDSNKKFFQGYCQRHYEWKLQQSKNAIYNYFN